MTQTILKINASARHEGSTSRALVEQLSDRLTGISPSHVINRDVSEGLPMVDNDWILASQIAQAERTKTHNSALTISDKLIAELKVANTVIIGVPIYNFGIPASLKSWIDQICRAGETFSYTENGPIGLLEGKTAYVVITSGGVESGSSIDFATNYMKHVLGFIGITDVHFVKADQLMFASEEKLFAARSQIETLAAA